MVSCQPEFHEIGLKDKFIRQLVVSSGNNQVLFFLLTLMCYVTDHPPPQFLPSWKKNPSDYLETNPSLAEWIPVIPQWLTDMSSFSCTPYSPLLPEALLGMLISLPLGWDHSITNCLFLAEKGVVAQCVNVPKAEFWSCAIDNNYCDGMLWLLRPN